MLTKITMAASIAAGVTALELEAEQVSVNLSRIIEPLVERAGDGVLTANDMYNTVCQVDDAKEAVMSSRWVPAKIKAATPNATQAMCGLIDELVSETATNALIYGLYQYDRDQCIANDCLNPCHDSVDQVFACYTGIISGYLDECL